MNTNRVQSEGIISHIKCLKKDLVVKRLIVLLTLVEANMFSGSMSVLSRPMSWTAPPNSGSESQIICLITTLISRTS